ncbi:MAG: hypothetical protein FWE66_01010 [Oscillospiraceae bacterium]|nr:hypothetical protein [Oscillospiraceae bacterium]
MSSNSTGLIISLLIFLPVILLWVYPPAVVFSSKKKQKPTKRETEKRLLRILEIAFSFPCFIVLTVSKARFEQAAFNLFFALWAVCLIFSLVPYALFFLNKRDLSALKKPLLFFPFPAVAFPTLALLFVSVWIGSILLAASAILFACGRMVWFLSDRHNE